MPASGKLTRSVVGKFLRDYLGRLRRCTLCCGGEACPLVIKAVPCTQCLDENCERTRPTEVWVCTDATCDSVEIGHTTPVVFHVESAGPCGDFCYRTVPGTEMAFDDLPPEDQAGVFSGAVDCVADCSDASCGDSQDTCACVCWNSTTTDLNGDLLADPSLSYCCLGKVDADGHLCWDWNTVETFKRWFTYTLNIGPIPGSDCCDEAEFLQYHAERRSIADPENFCIEACCKSHENEVRTVKNLVATSGSCDFWQQYEPTDTDDGDGVWSASGVFHENCTPVWMPERITVLQLYGPDNATGDCVSEGIRTVTETYTCDSVSITLTEEFWGCSSDTCIEGGEPVNCSYCREYQKYEETYLRTYNRPAASDVECDQCKDAQFP